MTASRDPTVRRCAISRSSRSSVMQYSPASSRAIRSASARKNCVVSFANNVRSLAGCGVCPGLREECAVAYCHGHRLLEHLRGWGRQVVIHALHLHHHSVERWHVGRIRGSQGLCGVGRFAACRGLTSNRRGFCSAGLWMWSWGEGPQTAIRGRRPGPYCIIWWHSYVCGVHRMVTSHTMGHSGRLCMKAIC